MQRSNQNINYIIWFDFFLLKHFISQISQTNCHKCEYNLVVLLLQFRSRRDTTEQVEKHWDMLRMLSGEYSSSRPVKYSLVVNLFSQPYDILHYIIANQQNKMYIVLHILVFWGKYIAIQHDQINQWDRYTSWSFGVNILLFNMIRSASEIDTHPGLSG